MNDVRDVIIIGGGPAGYTAALYAARANLNPLVIEGFSWGGQLMITSEVENYPGYRDGIMGPEMMAEFRAQAARFGTEFITDDVTRVDLSERPFKIYVGDDAATIGSSNFTDAGLRSQFEANARFERAKDRKRFEETATLADNYCQV